MMSHTKLDDINSFLATYYKWITIVANLHKKRYLTSWVILVKKLSNSRKFLVYKTSGCRFLFRILLLPSYSSRLVTVCSISTVVPILVYCSFFIKTVGRRREYKHHKQVQWNRKVLCSGLIQWYHIFFWVQSKG